MQSALIHRAHWWLWEYPEQAKCAYGNIRDTSEGNMISCSPVNQLCPCFRGSCEDNWVPRVIRVNWVADCGSWCYVNDIPLIRTAGSFLSNLRVYVRLWYHTTSKNQIGQSGFWFQVRFESVGDIWLFPNTCFANRISCANYVGSFLSNLYTWDCGTYNISSMQHTFLRSLGHGYHLLWICRN